MGLPYIQLSEKFITTTAPAVAGRLRVELPTVLGWGVILFQYAINQTSTPMKPPDGVLLDPEAAGTLEGMFGWKGESGRCIDAFVWMGVVERLEVGIRVKGCDRYKSTWEKNNRNKGNKPSPGRDPDGTRTGPGRDPEPTRPVDGDRDIDGDKRSTETTDTASRNSVSTDEQVTALRASWNELTAPPIPRWEEGKLLKRRAKAALKRRPMEQWRDVFRRIQASPYCRGEVNGWIADAEWAMRPEGNKPEPAAQVLSGKYDPRPFPTGPPLRKASGAMGYTPTDGAAWTEEERNEKF